MKARTLLVFAAMTVAHGCTCARSEPTSVASSLDAQSPSDGPSARDAAADAAHGDPRFSLPIAAARSTRGERTFVAGLRVPEKAISVSLLDDAGAAAWTVDVMAEASWSQDAELRAYAGKGGAWITWRGLVDKKHVNKARFISDNGEMFDPIDIGAANCAVGRTLYFASASSLKSREPEGASTQNKLPDTGADVSVLCTSTRALVLSEADDGSSVLVPEDGGVTRLRAFDGDSDGRTTLLFASTHGVSGVLRVAEKDVVIRELSQGKLAASRTEHVALVEDDDIVAVDAFEHGPALFFTRDDEHACDGGTAAPSIGAIFLGPKSDGGVGFASIADTACARERGPYWSNPVGDDLVFSWVERAERATKISAPIIGVGFSRLHSNGAIAEHGFIDTPADGIVDAGCDDKDCYAAALVRAPGDDDSKPEAIRVLALSQKTH